MLNLSTVKNSIFVLYYIALCIVFVGKIANWFLHFDHAINALLNTTMFILIGIFFLYASFIYEEIMVKAFILFSGVFLITTSFFELNIFLSIIKFICLLGPLILMKFIGNDEKDEALSTD